MTMNEQDLYHISAESLLNYLYPDDIDRWGVDCAGTFYRNYSPDVLNLDEDNWTVRLSRDSFLRLLPQGLIAKDNALKGKDFEQKYEQFKKEEELLLDLFRPVDTLAFRSRLHIEKQATQLLQERLTFVLKRYFDVDLDETTNPYIRQTAPLLLHVSQLRADFGFIRDLLEQLFDCDVEMKTGRYAWEEGAQYAQPAVEYRLIIPRLTREAYDELNQQIEPFREFLCEWFIPFDTKCTILIKDCNQPFVLGEGMMLNYNTVFPESLSIQNVDSK